MFCQSAFVHRFVKKVDELQLEIKEANADLQAFQHSLNAVDDGPVSDAARFVDVTMERLMPKNKKAKFQARIDSVVESSPPCESPPVDSDIAETAKSFEEV